MRTTIAVVIVLLTGIASAAWIQTGTGTGPAKVSVVAASASGATVTVEIPGVQTESVAINGVQYLKLAIPGAVSAVLDVGKPEVPAVPVLLARPTGSTVSLTILSIKTETLDVARVYPMQRPLKYGEQAGPLTVDNSFYASDVEYPSGRLSNPRTATWRDLDVVNVHVYPVAVRPAQHQVIVTSRIKFRVDFSGGHYPARVTGWMVPMYRRLIQNYDKLRLTTTAQDPPGTKCLVFCYNDYVGNASLDSLLSLMTKLGDSTEVINVPDSVQAVPESIKTTIINRYKSQNPPALHWVFLVGRHDQIPPDSCLYTWWSDYWYSDLDTLPGHVDSCDKYPEVGIARLSPDENDTADLSHQIAKIRDYILGTDKGDWLNRMTLVAGAVPEADSTVRAARAFAHDTARFFRPDSIDTIFGLDTAPKPNNTNIQLSVDRGTGVLIYLGHGKYDQWALWNGRDSWAVGDVEDLENPHTPVVFNLACLCGNVESGPCLSEKWMSKYCPPGEAGRGAVASFASYITAWPPSTNDECMVAVKAIGDYDTLHYGLNEYAAPVFDLGGIQMLMDADIATKWPDSAGASGDIYGFYWLGNPAMPVWSGGVPVSADVSYPSWITPGDDSFPVTVAIGGLGVEGAQVCAYKPGDFYAVGLTNEDGEVTLNLTANDTGSFFVSASKGHVSLRTPYATHTPMLPYFGTAVVCKPDSAMTYPNWSRKLVHGPTGNRLHVVYTGGGSVSDSVFYTQSTDGGDTWPIVEPIGAGSCPAIVLNDSVPVPWVVYLTSDSSIVRAIRSDTGASASWDEDTIFKRNDSARAGAPSLAARVPSTPPSASVAYPVYVQSQTDTSNFIYYNMFTATSVSAPETVDAAGDTFCYGPSIVVNPGLVEHVAWVKGQSIYYSQHLNPAWPGPYRISSQVPDPYITEPASNPSMEAYGDSFFCVWRGPDENGDSLCGDIWRRSHWLNWQPQQWPALPSDQSKTPDTESDFPVMATSFLTVWHEQVSPDSTDIWYRSLGDSVPHLLFQGWQFRYPQVDGYWIPNTGWFRCNTVWTEQTDSNPPQYALGFGVQNWIPRLGKGLGPDQRKDYEPASYYAAELGQSERSPYCLSRGGFARFDSWDMDTSSTVLSYRLPYLDPRKTYKLRAVMYHLGKDTWDIALRCDSGSWYRVRVAPNVPDTFWLQVPKALYKNDARILVDVACVTGDYASLTRLKLFQIEEEPGEDGGVQSWGTGTTFVTRLRGCAPNPFARGTSINYELAQYGPVELTVHDVSGRLVSRLESGPRQRGFHTVRWNGTGGSGRVVPAGVYFVRFSAGDRVSTGRLTLVR